MLEKQPKCHEALFGIAKNYFYVGSFDFAKTYFERALSIRKDPTYLIWIGYTYLFYSQQLSKIIEFNSDNKEVKSKAKITRESVNAAVVKYLSSKLACLFMCRMQQN